MSQQVNVIIRKEEIKSKRKCLIITVKEGGINYRTETGGDYYYYYLLFIIIVVVFTGGSYFWSGIK